MPIGERIRHEHPLLLFELISLGETLPMLLLAWVVGRITFHVMGEPTRSLWVAMAVPWLALLAADAVRYGINGGMPIAKALPVLIGWSVVSIPGGLWLASLRSRPIDAR